MKPYTTAERLKQLMNDRNLKQSDILQKVDPVCKRYGVKLGKSILSQYVSGAVEPGQEKLTVLGLALNVSEAWLMGYDVPMDREIAPVTNGNGRTEEFVELFQRLTPDEQALIIASIKGILSGR